ncbi:alpha/beta hydrolase [Aegicerativicinus sediminis]|uniref:alpha/beta hydrolase n=1 Tax=Aegicerativicinus sediminis TaxID=2893202 RepID=UPI001E37A9A3|nr:alpha/beta hydrolase [Aegicerativicinus sediminis]
MKWILVKLIGFYCNIASLFFPKHSGKLALKLFSIPRKGWIKKGQQDFLDTSFREELVYDDEAIMSYRWKGNGSTILLVHGWESNTARWESLIRLLQKIDLNIVAIDAPAHGNSGSYFFNVNLYSKFLKKIIERTKPNFVIAHSVGAMAVCKSFADLQNYTPKKMVLIGAPSKYEDILQRYIKMMGYNNRVSSNFKSRIVDIFKTSLHSINTASYAKLLNTPILVVHDQFDDVIPYNDALEIEAECRHSKLVTTKNMGHSLNNEVVNHHILEYVSS